MKKLVTREQLREFIKQEGLQSAEDVQTMLAELFGETLQEMLEAELEHELGYPKGAVTPSTNRRNGHSSKKVRSSYGELELDVPRDRQGEFSPVVVPKHAKSVVGIEDQIIALYSKGVSVRDIQDHLRGLYGLAVSPTLISQVTNRLWPKIEAWQNRPLERCYAVIFLDAIHYKVQDEGQIASKAAYTALGIDLAGNKEILGLWIGASESAKFWLGVLGELRGRGVADILIACTDNLAGFSEAIGAVFPQTVVQKCVVHQIRSSVRYVSSKDLKAVLADLRQVYTAPSEPAGGAALEEFATRWGEKYPLCVKSWRANWGELATCFSYPPELRRLIYTTNAIESFHRQLRKVTKAKSIFPSDAALLKMLYLATLEVSRKWTVRLPNWGQIILQLSILFPGRVKLDD